MFLDVYGESDQKALYAYWTALGKNIPYFFPVSRETWALNLLEDTLDGQRVFDYMETYVAKDAGRVVGFVQVGHPCFSWKSNGQKYDNPSIGIIRHFYFDSGRFDVAEAMFNQTYQFLELYQSWHAFFHAYGMSCNAYHGKLHMSLQEVDAFLLAKGFEVEHENVNYNLALAEVQRKKCDNLNLVAQPPRMMGSQDFQIQLEEKLIGTLTVRYLHQLTGGATTDAVYLTHLIIEKPYRGCGWGTNAINLLVMLLRDEGCASLHLDTSRANVRAQRFYEQFGFQNRGLSRSYINKFP